MTLEKVIGNLQGMEVTEDFVDDVICAFEDYNFEGETEVIVSKDESNNSNIDYQAYINFPNSPVICIKITNGKISDAWVA